MRLKQIRLAGFKSFVDATSFDVPSALVGVVGPNGCGKSNIIDAVRWVLGESRAGELRGESMQDVIFNGSDERKPASRSSVELVFDNSLGRIGGHWGHFGELSVRRSLGRDGQSSYFINQQQVRRRDVHDICLGTGLGPRAYAIIGQGTISRLIEARPEELRVFLEEAAGVSKYKERRRETEHRLSDTRENLTRVEDILRELNGQIERLEQQAQVAHQFRDLQVDRERKQAMLWLLRREEAAGEKNRVAQAIVAARNEAEARLAELRATEVQIERQRQAHQQAGDAVHAAQGAYYEANGEVSRIESEIRFVAQSRVQLEHQLGVARAACEAAAQRHATDSATLAGEGRTLEQALVQEEAAATEAAQRDAEIAPAEARVQAAAAALETCRAAVAEARQRIELSGAQQRALNEALR
ncbi:MAG: AAA family ATPase, partial [Burkholderiales bacterium]